MPFVVFAAPFLSDNAFRMIDAVASLPGVTLGVVTHDEAGRLRHLADRVAHWRVSNALDPQQLAWAARELQQRNGPVHRLYGALEQLQEPLAVVRQRMGIEGVTPEVATNFRDKARMKSMLRDAGLPCARHCLAASIEEARDFGERSGFPMVVKPPAGAGAISTFRVESMDQLQRALAANPPTASHPVLLEEFVVGDEHSFETVTIGGLADLKPRQEMTLDITFANGTKKELPVLCRIDTEDELSYYTNGGILPYVLRNLAAA